MKKFILFAAAAAMFAACANENDLALTQQQAANETDANLISFDAYTMRSTTTRAGWAGEVTTGTGSTDGLKGTGELGTAGFGVFAYYTDNFDYTPLYVPNFMYNEQVTWQTDQFKYALPKYWPNEHGSAATSADQDRVSFFAYAPYVDVDPSTGMLTEGGALLDASDEKLQWGITGMKRNSLQGDPVVQYITSFDQEKSVDLCWATTGTSDITWSTNNATQKIAAGYPWLNVRKPDGVVGDGAKVRFNFQHATAKLTVKVQTDNTGGWLASDNEDEPGPNAKATKVWIRSIRFTGIAQKAALNLNNPKTAAVNKARWMDYYGTNELELGESVTVYDGRKDGSEGVLDAIAPNEAILGLNPAFIQNEGQIVNNEWITSGAVRSGVTSTPTWLFCKGDAVADDAIYVIPTGEKFTVEIVYDIETIDKKLSTMLSDGETPGSTIENCISKAITFGTATSKLENGKSYTLNLKLGLKDVQFDASVNEIWDNGGSADAYLPNNMPAFAAYTTGANLKLGISGDQATYTFAITGLNADEGVTASSITSPVKASEPAPEIKSELPSGTANVASSSGIAFVTVGLTPHTDVTNNITDGNITVSGSTSGKKVILDITQYAVKLGLTAPSTGAGRAAKAAKTAYTYTSNATTGKWQTNSTGASGTDYFIKVKLDGVELTPAANDGDDLTTGKYYFNEGTLKLGDATSDGKVIEITIKTGDVAAETVSFTVGS